jgi:hypothetical protein
MGCLYGRKGRLKHPITIDVRFGLSAACHHHIRRTIGFERIAATQIPIGKWRLFERLLSPIAAIQIAEFQRV